MSLKRKLHHSSTSTRRERPLVRVTRLIWFLDLLTKQEEVVLESARRGLMSALTNIGLPSTTSTNESEYNGQAIFGMVHTTDDQHRSSTEGHRAVKRQVTHWENRNEADAQDMYNNNMNMDLTHPPVDTQIAPYFATLQSSNPHGSLGSETQLPSFDSTQVYSGTQGGYEEMLGLVNFEHQVTDSSEPLVQQLSSDGVSHDLFGSLVTPRQVTVTPGATLRLSHNHPDSISTSSGLASDNTVPHGSSLFSSTGHPQSRSHATSVHASESMETCAETSFANPLPLTSMPHQNSPDTLKRPLKGARYKKGWEGWERDKILNNILGPGSSPDRLDVAAMTVRHPKASTRLAAMWDRLRSDLLPDREIAAIIKIWWASVDSFHDIFDLILYVCETKNVSWEECETILDDEGMLTRLIGDAVRDGKLAAGLKAEDVTAWRHQGWFDLMFEKNIRNRPDTQRSGASAYDHPISPLPNKVNKVRRTSVHSDVSAARTTMSAPPSVNVATAFSTRVPVPSPSLRKSSSTTPAPMPPPSLAHSAGSSRRQPSMLSQYSIVNKDVELVPEAEPEVETLDQSTSSAPSIPYHIPALSELVRQNRHICDMLSQLVDAKTGLLQTAGQAESAQVRRADADHAMHLLGELAAIQQKERDAVRVRAHAIMVDKNAPIEARQSSQTFLLKFHDVSGSAVDFDDLFNRLERLHRVRSG